MPSRRALRICDTDRAPSAVPHHQSARATHAFGERPVLKLMYAALIRASQTWRRVVIGECELKQIEEIECQLDQEFNQRTASTIQSASRPGYLQQREGLTTPPAHSAMIIRNGNTFQMAYPFLLETF
jgi:hypothetical protein